MASVRTPRSASSPVGEDSRRLATRVDLRLSRLRWVFYAFYPLHLALLWWLRDGHRYA